MMKFEFIDKAMWFPAEKMLAIGDLHIGYEDALNKQGVFVPRSQFEIMIDDLKKIFDKIGKVNEVIVLGDLKHEFGSILEQEWRETLAVLDFLKENSKKVILIKGNHDKMLESIVKNKGMNLTDSYVVKDVCFMHGDKLINFDKKIKMIVMGHKHPALVVADKYKSETYKCFLVGKWKGKKAIILPSFFPLVEGSEIGIDEGKFIIPDSKLEDFEAYVVGDRVYRMGKVKNIRRLR